MLTEKLTAPTTADKSLCASVEWYENSHFCVIFKESCWKEKEATFAHLIMIIFFIIYKLNTWSRILNSDFTLKDCLFGGVKLAKNADPDKYFYSGYSIGFDSHSLFTYQDIDWGKNVVIYRVDNGSSVYVNKREKIS